MENVSRLSIADFKLKKLENKSEIEKLLGGVASGCHLTYCPNPNFGPSAGNIMLLDTDDCHPAVS